MPGVAASSSVMSWTVCPLSPPDTFTLSAHALYTSSAGRMSAPNGPEQLQTTPTLIGFPLPPRSRTTARRAARRRTAGGRLAAR